MQEPTSHLWTSACGGTPVVPHWCHLMQSEGLSGTMAADRFLQLADVADILNISSSQTYALVRSGELPAIKIGGRGQWRVERTALEDYIQRCYAETRAFVSTHPLGGDEPS